MTAIEQLDVTDDAAVAEFYAIQSASLADPYATLWTLPEVLAVMRRTQPYFERLWWSARDDAGRVVGWGAVDLPLAENTTLAEVDGGVAPLDRGKGHGRAILLHVLDVARKAGRRSVIAGTSWAWGEDGNAGRHLLETAGLTLRETDAQRVLDLPVPVDRLDRLAAEAAPHHADYELAGWSGPCPDRWVHQYAVLVALMGDEAPTGDLEVEAHKVDAQRVRDAEVELVAQRRLAFTTIALAKDGTVAGHTQIVVPETDTANAYQWDTLVLREHRGHRLGLALKVHNHRAAATALEPRRLMHTWNSLSNDPMVRVNEALGYRPVRRHGNFQGDL